MIVKDKNSFGERLKFVLDKLHYSGNAFAQVIGVGGSLVHKTLRGQNQPSVKFCMAIYKHFPEINWDYMITGRGEAFLLPEKLEEKVISTDEQSFYPLDHKRSPLMAGDNPIYNRKDAQEAATKEDLIALENKMHEKLIYFTNTTLSMIRELAATKK